VTDWRTAIGVALEDVGFGIRGNKLHVGEVPARQLLTRHAPGPLYVFDQRSITRRLDRLRSALDPGIAIKYAVKANPNADVVRCLSRAVDGFDVASVAELQTVLQQGVDPARISLAGPGKPADLLQAAVDHGIVVSAESSREIHLLAALAETSARRPSVLVRINPDFSLRGSGMRMSGLASPFGIDSEAAASVLQSLPPELEFAGLHVFCGSQCLSNESLLEAYDAVFGLARQLAAHSPDGVPCINLGAGLGIPYFTGDQPVDLERLAGHLNRLLEDYRQWSGDGRVELEMGRYLVGEAGIYLCTIIDRKESRGEVFLITDGGMHHHLAASGNLGQVVKRNYPICVANRVEADHREKVTVVGHLCTPLDVLGRGVELPRAEAGDIIAIFQSGAYGLSASPTAFLGHPIAREVLVTA
jgi:diaminopimelate decarboxylase